jgi:rubredoxin
VLLPRLIPTDSVVRWIEMTELALADGMKVDALPLHLSEALSEDWPVTKPLSFSSHSHEDVEGFMPMSSGRLALNLYNNHHPWSLSFLSALMDLAQSREIAQVYITTGRSLLIKHIKASERLIWEGLLSRHNMTIRHSGADLAWIVGSHLPGNVALKRRLQKRLDSEGLAFSQTHISIDPPRVDDRATLYVRRHRHWYGQRYELLYKKNFNPLSEICISAGRELSFADLLEKLIKVHQSLYARPVEGESVLLQPYVYRSSKVTRYECAECLSCYDEAYGDPARGILEGTSFELLPDSWNCELCEADKASFAPLRN